MPHIDLHGKAFDEATKTKLLIFESYLKAWLPVFIYKPIQRKINVCDFFAGRGKDISGTPGSPLRIISTIKAFRKAILQKEIKIDILLNEADKNKFKTLKETVAAGKKELADLKDVLNFRYFNEDFDKLFNDQKGNLKDEANLFFIDQNGIKHVTKERIKELDSFLCADYLFFSSSSYLKRFDFDKYFPDLIIKGVEQTEIHRKLLEYYRHHLPEKSKTKLYPFTLKKNRNIYGLIFGSQHILGVDKFLKIAWGLNPVNGEANFDIDDDNSKKQLELFGKKMTKIESFKENLKKYIVLKKKITNNELYHYTLERGFIPKYAQEVLKEMREEKQLEHYSYPYLNYDSIYKKKKKQMFVVKK